MRLELKDLQFHFDEKFPIPASLLRVTMPSGQVTRYWNQAVGLSALKNPGKVEVEILAFTDTAVNFLDEDEES